MKSEKEIKERQAYYHLEEFRELKKRIEKLPEEEKDIEKALDRMRLLQIERIILEAKINELRWVLELPEI